MEEKNCLSKFCQIRVMDTKYVTYWEAGIDQEEFLVGQYTCAYCSCTRIQAYVETILKVDIKILHSLCFSSEFFPQTSLGCLLFLMKVKTEPLYYLVIPNQYKMKFSDGIRLQYREFYFIFIGLAFLDTLKIFDWYFKKNSTFSYCPWGNNFLGGIRWIILWGPLIRCFSLTMSFKRGEKKHFTKLS